MSDFNIKPKRRKLSRHSENDEALYMAAQAGDLSQCETLLTGGANVNYVNSEQYCLTPLHTASLHGRTEVCRILLEKSADIECKNSYGNTPLHLASREGHLDTARLLVTRGARTDAAQREGDMPIHKAAWHNRHEVVEFLVREAGVSVDVVSNVLIN